MSNVKRYKKQQVKSVFYKKWNKSYEVDKDLFDFLEINESFVKFYKIAKKTISFPIENCKIILKVNTNA